MKRYGYLYEKIISFDNLLLAAEKAFRGKKDKHPVAAFYFDLENEIIELQNELLSNAYKPRPLRIFKIREPKVREIAAADFRDRVVHHAVCNVLEPIFEKSYIFHSYACRREKGLHRAVKQAQTYCRRHPYFLKLDIEKYFGSVDHEVLRKMLRGKFRDPRLLSLLDVVIDSAKNGGRGIPIGSLTSQHFANFYLDKLDHFIKETLAVSGYLRYMDDFILFADNKAELHILKARISTFLKEELRLRLKEKACLLAPCLEGVPFLGFRIFPGLIRVRTGNKKRSLRKLKQRAAEFGNGEIDETRYSRSLMSITEHVKIADSYRFRKSVYKRMFYSG